MTSPHKADRQQKPQPVQTRKAHYVLSTHWDREWYLTFQDFRRRLVHLFDRCLGDLESGKLRGPFTTDGQSILLEDYLEIRPERRSQLEAFAKSGKLKLGPWYVLPDEWLVSGESLIRNLRLGRKIARDFGGVPSDAGFVCDLFGHVGQLPQILGGFGIKAGLIWRGLEPRDSAHVIWEGADGTRLPCYRFGRAGYCDYTWDVRRCTQPDVAFDEETAKADLKAFLAKEAARTDIPPILLFDGGDHLEYDDDHYRLLFAGGPDFPYKVEHGTLDSYLEEMLAHAGSISTVVKGELLETGRLPSNIEQQWLIPGVLSSRVWIKQANAECQSLLCHWAEPFALISSSFAGAEYPAGYLDLAWKWLLQNHPHDSICGCSIDEVHEDMKYRFAQCRQIAEAQTAESLNHLASSLDGDIADGELRVLVANPLPSVLDEPVTLTLQIPEDWGCYQEFFGFEPKPAFRIFGEGGNELNYQLIAQDMGKSKKALRPLKFPALRRTNDITVCLPLHIPALGYTTVSVRKGEISPQDGVIPAQSLPTRHPQSPRLATSERSMENGLLRVTIEANGTLTIEDKRTGQVYSRLLTFEDVADIGDGWYHGVPVNDQQFVSSAARSDIALVSDGPLYCQFRVRTVLNLPKEFDFGKRTRSEEFQSLLVESLVGLRAGSDRVEIETTVDNTCKDHRLRVLFPSGCQTDTYLADSAFDVVKRKIGLPEDNHLARELTVETTPQQTWTAISQGKRGLAVVSAGLMESCVRDLPERPLALTLFRSTRKTVLTDGQPEGQLQGKMRFDYWIIPLAGKPGLRQLCDAGTQLAAGIRTAQLRKEDLAQHKSEKKLPPSASFLKVDGEVVTTSVRQIDAAMEVRLFNPNMRKTDASLDFGNRPTDDKRLTTMVRVNLESVPVGKTTNVPAIVRVSLKPKEIVTLRFE